MYGPPQDVQGECNARLYLGDDYGDNECTIRCQREPGHEGKHREVFGSDGRQVTIEWELDEREERREAAEAAVEELSEEPYEGGPYNRHPKYPPGGGDD